MEFAKVGGTLKNKQSQFSWEIGARWNNCVSLIPFRTSKCRTPTFSWKWCGWPTEKNLQVSLSNISNVKSDMSNYIKTLMQACQNIFWEGLFVAMKSHLCLLHVLSIKVQDGTWTFEHEFLKKLLMGNVYLKDIPLAGHLYRVSMQKVPQILSQKTGKISKSHVFPIKKRQKQHTLKRKILICHLGVVLS